MTAASNSGAAQATSPGDGMLRVSGPLTFDTVPAVLEQSTGWMRQSAGSMTVDLEQVQRADSAGLALLVEWVRAAQAKGAAFKVINVPEQMRSLIRVNGLGDVLGV